MPQSEIKSRVMISGRESSDCFPAQFVWTEIDHFALGNRSEHKVHALRLEPGVRNVSGMLEQVSGPSGNDSM